MPRQSSKARGPKRKRGRTRSPSVVDRHVGKRLHQRRRSLGVTQVDLARALGVTPAQLWKYERGFDRIPAGRLYRAAQALDVPMAHFFEGLPPPDPSPPPVLAPEILPQTLEAVRAFQAIPKAEHRTAVLALLKSSANDL